VLFTSLFVFTIVYVYKNNKLKKKELLEQQQHTDSDNPVAYFDYKFCCVFTNVHFFDRILLYINLGLLSRIIFLSTGYRSKHNKNVSFEFQSYIETLPFFFTAMTITCILKFKL
jgi:hypothetical protein